jgi:hypothetical protein
VKRSTGPVPFETDEGEWRGGRQAGFGSQVWPSGRYDGELLDGEPHGHGVMVVQGARYQGDFSNGRPNGAGTLTNGGGSFQGTWTNGCFREGTRRASFRGAAVRLSLTRSNGKITLARSSSYEALPVRLRHIDRPRWRGLC